MSTATNIATEQTTRKEHLHCYGRIFPSHSWRQPGKDRPDAVFGLEFQQQGSVSISPGVTVDLRAWDRCVECDDFATCQQLSMAKLMLEMAVRN